MTVTFDYLAIKESELLGTGLADGVPFALYSGNPVAGFHAVVYFPLNAVTATRLGVELEREVLSTICTALAERNIAHVYFPEDGALMKEIFGGFPIHSICVDRAKDIDLIGGTAERKAVCHVVYTDGRVQEVNLPSDGSERLQFFQQSVGGFIEPLYLNSAVVDYSKWGIPPAPEGDVYLMLLNEEGQWRKLPENPTATGILIDVFGQPQNPLVGNAVIVLESVFEDEDE